MNRIAGRAVITILLVAALLGGLVFFTLQFADRADEWVIFPGSPHVYNGTNLGTGMIADRDGILLLDMQASQRHYSGEETLRRATVHWVGDRNGSVYAPTLSHYAAQIAGYRFSTGLYHYGEQYGAAYLTLSAPVQAAALEAMGEHKGTVAVYNYKTGEILCAVTTPSFDPNQVPDVAGDESGQYDGIFVNRFTAGTYTPGSIFKLVTLAAALEEKSELLEQTFVCTGELEFGADKITCEDPHWEQSLQTAFRNSCNCAFAQIAQELGADVLTRYVKKFQVIEPVQFDGMTTAAGNFDVQNAADVSLGWAGIGQYTDLINPCAFLNFIGAIANGGRITTPYIVERITFGNRVTYSADSENGERIMRAETAEILQKFMRFNVQDKYGDDHFPGLTVCAKTGTGEVGEQKKPNAMLAGFVQDENLPLAFIVCIEDGGYGSKTCIPIASSVLSACKTVQ